MLKERVRNGALKVELLSKTVIDTTNSIAAAHCIFDNQASEMVYLHGIHTTALRDRSILNMGRAWLSTHCSLSVTRPMGLTASHCFAAHADCGSSCCTGLSAAGDGRPCAPDSCRVATGGDGEPCAAGCFVAAAGAGEQENTSALSQVGS